MTVTYEFRDDDTHMVQMRSEEHGDGRRFVEFLQDPAGIVITVKDPSIGVRERRLILFGEEVALLAKFLRGESFEVERESE